MVLHAVSVMWAYSVVNQQPEMQDWKLTEKNRTDTELDID